MAPLSYYFILSAVLFTTGVVGVLVRKNPLIIFMSIELMLNAANLSFVSFARFRNLLSGQVIAFFVITVAAAEVVVGLAIIVAIFRTKATVDVDEITTLRG
ncbi:MAG TPA: NADH-quinone oxidoreductase subunit NuoK [Thermomicrobiales bacterium]|nr:NADH-quinone oxidoreductase subunit NuoK [Thermomicrobiales bacterium]